MDQNIAMVILLVVALLLMFSRGGTTHHLSAYTDFDISKVTPRTIVNSLGLVLAIVGVQKMLRHPIVTGDSVKGTDGLAAYGMGGALEASKRLIQSKRLHALAKKIFPDELGPPKPPKPKSEWTPAEVSFWSHMKNNSWLAHKGGQAHPMTESQLKIAKSLQKVLAEKEDGWNERANKMEDKLESML